MKQIILLLAIAFSFCVSQTYSQCVPNTAITQPGIYPDSATGLVAGTVGIAYNEVVQVKVPLDTFFIVPIQIDSISVLSFSGFPPGITFACNTTNCQFPGGSNGCILLSGTPTTAGTYPLKAVLSARGHTINGNFQIPAQIDTVDYYTIVINQANGIQNNANLKFDVAQNEPNPFNNTSNISFTVAVKSTVTFKVFNLIGKEIFRNNVLCDPGKNIIKVDAADFAPGVYMYSLSNGAQTFTKRMIVSKK